MVPLRAKDGGVLVRPGHTEAAVDLCRLAGLAPVGAIGELVNDDGTMMRLPQVLATGEAHDLPVITIAALVAWRQRHDRVVRLAETTLPTEHGTFAVTGYRDVITGDEHLALVSPRGPQGRTPLVRLHSECLTGDVLGSQRCDCGPQLHRSLQRVAAEGGVVVYLRGHEGRGVGLLAKLQAYALQDRGFDTVDAQVELGLPIDAREYAAGAAILTDLGITSVRLLTNNPLKVNAMREHGIDVVAVERISIAPVATNAGYLQDQARPHGAQPHARGRGLGGHRVSGKGAPVVTADGSGLRVAVVAASWHTAVMDGLIAGAQRALTEAGVVDAPLVRVPGTVELSVACARLAPAYDALVALGVVIRGGTPHFEYVCSGVTHGLTDVSTRTGVPIGFGVLTCDDDAQALDRAGLSGSSEDKGHEAAMAAVATAVTLASRAPRTLVP